MERLEQEYQMDLNDKHVLSEHDRHKLENRKKRKFVRRFLNKHVVDYEQLDDDNFGFLYN